jgi:hypothetical protein
VAQGNIYTILKLINTDIVWCAVVICVQDLTYMQASISSVGRLFETCFLYHLESRQTNSLLSTLFETIV